MATSALAALQEHCVRCHGSDPAQRTEAPGKPRGDFGFVDDLDRLAAFTDYVNPGNPETSLLFQVIADGSMPQDTKGAMQPAQQTAVADWIRSLGKVRAAPRLFGEREIIDAILGDLDDLRRRGVAEGRVRYLTLSHFHNLGEDVDTLRFLRDGAAKVVFSLSWVPTVKPLEAVGPEGSLLRIELDQIGWSPAKWELLVERYPYGILRGTDEERDLQKRTGTQMPYLRADWFAFQATRPPLYEQLLAPGDAPGILDTEVALEQYLGINVAENIYRGRAVRYGIPHRKSGVSFNNRLLERHDIRRHDGGYWRSYDFKSSSGRRNLLTHPLGPVGLTTWPDQQENEAAFRHDGGELIWNLPNGLQAYLLVDATGKRIEEGPLDIVFDKQETTRKRGVIVNGISCIACHQAGMKQPLVKEAVRPNAATFHKPRVQQTVERLYATDPDFQRLLDADTLRFQNALRRAGIADSTLQNQRDPVVELAQRFEQRLSADIAAAELAMRRDDLLDSLARDLKTILRNDLLDRDEWVLRFGEVVAATNRGELLHAARVRRSEDEQNAGPSDANGPVLADGHDPKLSKRLVDLLNAPPAAAVGVEELLALAKNPKVRIDGEALWLAALHIRSERSSVLAAMLERADVNVNDMHAPLRESILSAALPPWGNGQPNMDINEQAAMLFLRHPKADPSLLDRANSKPRPESPFDKVVRLLEELEQDKSQWARSRFPTAIERSRVNTAERRIEQLRRIADAMEQLRAR